MDDADGGPYVIRVAATDRLGNVIVADRVLTISGKADTTKLRILADRVSFKVGETASVRLHSRVPEGAPAAGGMGGGSDYPVPDRGFEGG